MPQTGKILGKRELAKIQKRKAILAATLQVLQKKGHRDTTIEDIAEAAGVAKGTLYLYYIDKDDLVAAAFADYFTASMAPYQTLDFSEMSKPEILGLFQTMLTAGIKAADFCTVFFEVMGPELRQTKSPVVDMAKQCFADLASVLDREMQKLAEAGRLTTSAQTHGIGRTIAATIDGIVLHAAFFRLPKKETELAVQNYIQWMDMLIRK